MVPTITFMLVNPKPTYLALTLPLSTRSSFLLTSWNIFISMSPTHLSLHTSQKEPSGFPANLVTFPVLPLPIWLISLTTELTSEGRSLGVILDISASSVCQAQMLPHSVSWICAHSFLCTASTSVQSLLLLVCSITSPLTWAPSFWPPSSLVRC